MPSILFEARARGGAASGMLPMKSVMPHRIAQAVLNGFRGASPGWGCTKKRAQGLCMVMRGWPEYEDNPSKNTEMTRQ
jgi:hypothetical protein